MKCPFCGKENEKQAKTCIRCKAGIPHEKNILNESTNSVSDIDDNTNTNSENGFRLSKRNKKERENNGT